METLLILFSLFLVAIVLLAIITRRRKDSADEQEAAVHAACNTAAVAIIGWLTPHVRTILSAEIEPEEGVVLQLDSEEPSTETMQHLVVIAIAGTAGEAYAFDGGVRVLAAIRDWTAAGQVASQLIRRNDGSAALPWLSLASTDDEAFISPTGVTPDAETKDMIHASFLYAIELLSRHDQAFERLIDLLLEKKKLEEQELTRFLGTMVPLPPRAS